MNRFNAIENFVNNYVMSSSRRPSAEMMYHVSESRLTDVEKRSLIRLFFCVRHVLVLYIDLINTCITITAIRFH